MGMSYKPPFKITSKAVNLISQISADMERFKIRLEQEDGVRLRKINRMKTIQGSLAIEGNTLTEEQVTALIEGKHVIAPMREVQEVKNAIKVYEKCMSFNPYKEKDLLKAHEILTMGLLDNPGHFRKGGVCIAGKNGISHIAPPADRVPFLMNDLFDWLKSTDVHPLIKSCVFHYEFEFIHPFEDGNGRMGRLWQTVILTEWKPIFAWLPIETLIKENQKLYYKALGISDNNADSTEFIEFMLSIILKTIKEIITTELKITQKITQKITVNQQKIIASIKNNPYITQEELAEIVGIARLNIIKNMKKLQEQNIIKRIGADKNGYWQIIDEK
ncbi:Fic family protein [Treponema denticola]|uniref:Fic family protein n=1 Tax=Treponema denticola TaxID=158 RepID=UPI00164E7F77|nr:Fic family protein [Treponema denticola]